MAIVINENFHRATGPTQEYLPWPANIIDPNIGYLHPERYSRQENVFSNAAPEDVLESVDIETNDQAAFYKRPGFWDKLFAGLGKAEDVYRVIKDDQGQIIDTEITPGHEYQSGGLQPWHYIAIIGGLAMVVLIAVKLKPGKE